MTLTVESSCGKIHDVTLPDIPAFKKYARKLYASQKREWVIVKANREPLFLVGVCGEKVYEAAFAKEE